MILTHDSSFLTYHSIIKKKNKGLLFHALQAFTLRGRLNQIPSFPRLVTNKPQTSHHISFPHHYPSLSPNKVQSTLVREKVLCPVQLVRVAVVSFHPFPALRVLEADTPQFLFITIQSNLQIRVVEINGKISEIY